MSEQLRLDVESDLNSLPLDVLRTIANFLDNASKLKIRLANTHWFNIIKYSDFSLFFRSPTIEAKQIADRFLKYNWPISIKIKKSFIPIPKTAIPSQFARLTNLTSLDVSAVDELNSLDWRPLTSCQRLTHLDTLFISDMKALGCFPWMKFLHFEMSDVYADRHFDFCQRLKKHTNLDNLSITIDKCREEIYVELFSSIANPSKLTSLTIHMGDACNLDHGKMSRLINLQTLVCTSYDVRLGLFNKPVVLSLDSKTSLQSLSLRNNYNLNGFENCTTLTYLEIVPTSDATYWRHLSKLSKLKAFSVHECFSSDLNERLEFMTGLTDLTEFHIASEHMIDRVFEYLPSSVTHLNVVWYQTEDQEILNLWQKCMDDIGRLTNLKELHLEDSGKLGKTDCCAIKNWTNLEKLSSHVNSVTLLAHLTKLKELKLPKAVETAEFPVLPNLEKLIMFDMEGFHLPIFAKMTRLTHLESEAYKRYSYCPNLTGLEHLPLKFLKSNSVDTSSYSKITTLESLTAFLMTEDAVFGLTGLKNLTTLAARGLPHSALFCLTRLTNLRDLELPLELYHLNDTKYLLEHCFPNIRYF